MVAFNATLSEEGLVQLRHVILARTRKFASKLNEFQDLLPADKDEVRGACLSFILGPPFRWICAVVFGNLN
jgi:hypothetical protein